MSILKLHSFPLFRLNPRVYILPAAILLAFHNNFYHNFLFSIFIIIFNTSSICSYFVVGQRKYLSFTLPLSLSLPYTLCSCYSSSYNVYLNEMKIFSSSFAVSIFSLSSSWIDLDRHKDINNNQIITTTTKII